jgi:hypothetical protein
MAQGTEGEHCAWSVPTRFHCAKGTLFHRAFRPKPRPNARARPKRTSPWASGPKPHVPPRLGTGIVPVVALCAHL